MKLGIITSYNPKLAVGTIFVNSVVGERYFFYANKIVAGPPPSVGAEAYFNVSSKTPKPGQLPYAVNITVLQRPEITAGGLEALGGTK